MGIRLFSCIELRDAPGCSLTLHWAQDPQRFGAGKEEPAGGGEASLEQDLPRCLSGRRDGRRFGVPQAILEGVSYGDRSACPGSGRLLDVLPISRVALETNWDADRVGASVSGRPAAD